MHDAVHCILQNTAAFYVLHLLYEGKFILLFAHFLGKRLGRRNSIVHFVLPEIVVVLIS